MRHASRTCLLALAVAASLAGPLPAKDLATGKRGAPAEAGERPFIEASLVLAPERVGDWRLVQARDFEGQPEAGVGLRYEHAAHPDVRVDLFVYPVGRVDPATELDQRIAGMRGDIEAGVASGQYARADFDAPVDFPIPRPAPDGAQAPGETGAPAGTRAAAADAPPADPSPLAVALAAEDAARATIPGRKFRVVLEWNLAEVESRAYLFHRGLYLYKGRISASLVTMAGDALDALADEAMATLVPAIRVRSTGGCHGLVLEHDPANGADALALAMARSVWQAQEEGCAPALDDAVPEGHRALRLDFPAALWRSGR